MSDVTRERRARPALCGLTYHPIKSCTECNRIWKQSRKKAMPIKAIGPPCPECGDTESRSQQRGWSEPDDHFLRYRKCGNCDTKFVTAEVVVPLENTTFYRLDYRGREWRREHYRAKYARTNLRLPVAGTDQLHITVDVVPHKRRADTCVRGHEFTPENTYVNPSTGSRSCRLCRSNQQKRYAIERRSKAA